MSEKRLTRAQAREALQSCLWRMNRTVDGEKDDTSVEVFFDDNWLSLGRMDERDEVRSSIGFTTDSSFYSDPVAYYRGRVMFGALVTPSEFFVIDSFSDG